MNAKNLALNLLIKAKDLASGTLDKFQDRVRDSGNQAEHLDGALQNAGKTTGHFADQLSEADKAAGRFYDKQGKLREATGQFVAGARRAGESTESFRKRLEGTSSTANSTASSIGGLTTKIVALAGTYLGVTALKNALTGLINTGSRFEDMQVQLNTLMGSIKDGEQATAWIKDFATNTPADIAGVTEGFIKLKAFGIDPMNGSYQAIMDQTAKLGFSQEKLDGIVLAVGQAWTKQKLQGEEALQLIERGVPVWDLLAKATGKNTVELQKMSSAGQLGRREITLLIQEMGKSSEGASADAMRTWTGLVSNMKDMWLNFINDINEAGFLDYMKEQLKALLDQVKEMAADGSLQKWAREISDGLISVAEGIKSVVVTTAEWSKEIGLLVVALAGLKLTAMIKGLASVAQNMRSAATATTALSTATAGLSGTAAGLGSAWGWLKKAGTGLKNLAGYLAKGGRLLTGVGLLAAGVKLIADRWREAQKAEWDAHDKLQQSVLDAMDRQSQYLDAMNAQLKTEKELKSISREGYEAYKQRLQNAQSYWQARVDAEKGEIQLGKNREAQLQEAQARLDEYNAAYDTLKAVVTDVNTLKSQGLTDSIAGQEVLNELLDAEIEKTDEQKTSTEKLSAAYNTLGLNVAVLKNQVTEQGEAAVDAFDLVVRKGNLSSEQIRDAFNAALSQTTTVADAELLRNVIKQLGKDGKLTGRDLQDAMNDANDQIEKLKDGTSDAKDETQKLKTEVDRLNEELENSGKTGVGHVGDLTEAMKELAEVVKTLAGEYKNATDEAEKLTETENSRKNNDGEKSRTSRSRLGATQYYDLTKSGNTEAAVRFQELADAYGKTMEGLVLGPKGAETMETELNALMQQALQQTKAPTKAPVTTSTPIPSPAPSRTVRVELYSQGRDSVVASVDESDTERFLQLLSDVGRVSG